MSFFASLRARLIVLAFLMILPILGLTLFQFVEQRNTAIQLAQDSALRLAGVVVSVQEHLTEEARHLLEEMIQFSGGDTVRCSTTFATLLRENPAYVNLAAAAPDGTVFCSALRLAEPVNVAEQPFFRRAVETRDFSIGDYQISHLAALPVLTYSYPVFNETDQLHTVVFASLDLAWLNRLVAEITLPANAAFTVFDQAGTILAHYPDPERWLGQAAPDAQLILAAIDQQGQGTLEVEGEDGVQRLYAFTGLQSAPDGGKVCIAISIPAHQVFAPANQALARNLITLGVVTALALGIAWAGANMMILRHVNRLLHTTRQLSQGDLSARTHIAYDGSELSQLARAFDEMASALQQRDDERKRAEAALRESQAFLERAQEVGHVGSWVADPTVEGGAINWSNETYHIFGLSKDQFDGRLETFLALVHPEDRDAVLKTIETALNHNKPYNIEHRIIRPRGIIRWVHQQADIIRDDSGSPRKIIGVVHDITERKQAEETLQLYAVELERRVAERTAELHDALQQEKNLNEMKLHFASMVSHEFRTPLAAIRLSSDVLKKFQDKLTDDKRNEHLDKIQSRVRLLVEMLDQLLTINRADTVGLEFNPVSLNLDAFCRDLVEETLDGSSTRQITLSTSGDCANVYGDEKLLQHIVTNLLSNAVKYSPNGGTVNFDLGCDKSQIVITVQDEGIGIPEDDQKNLFGTFHRAQNVIGIPGTGLGLAITKRAVEAHGGTISVESKEGAGSTFVVRLPNNTSNPQL